MFLPRQRELEVESEVVSDGGIAAGGEQRGILLHVVIEAHSDEFGEGVVSKERELEGGIAAGGCTGERGYVTTDGCLLAIRQVEAQVEVMIEIVLTSRIGGLVVVVTTLATFHLTMVDAESEETEVVDAIAQSDDPVLADCLIDLDTGHGEREDTCGSIFNLGGKVVVHGDIDTEQWGEGLVDAHLRYVVHGAGDGHACLCLGDEAKSVHVFLPCTVALIRVDRVDALIGMVEVNALEQLAEPRKLAETAISDGPVGQHADELGEYLKPIATHAGIGIEEGGYHDVTTILIDFAILGCLGMDVRTMLPLTVHIHSTIILPLDALLIAVERGYELIERLGVIAIGGTTHGLEGRTDGDGGHSEGATLRGRRTLVHVLDALGGGDGTYCVEINLQVLDGFEGHA